MGNKFPLFLSSSSYTKSDEEIQTTFKTAIYDLGKREQPNDEWWLEFSTKTSLYKRKEHLAG